MTSPEIRQQFLDFFKSKGITLYLIGIPHSFNLSLTILRLKSVDRAIALLDSPELYLSMIDFCKSEDISQGHPLGIVNLHL